MTMQSRRREPGGSSGELDVFGATSYFAGPQPAPDSAKEPSADLLYLQANKVQQRDTTRMTTTTEGNSFRGPHQQQKQQLAGVHEHDRQAERHATNTNKLLQVVAANAKRQLQPSGKSKLAALLSFMVSPSPSPRASFRKEVNKEAPLSARLLRQAAEAASAAAAGGEKEPASNNTYKAAANYSPSSSSLESSGMQLQGLFGAHEDNDDDELDLGVVTGDRRLQGITVVRGGLGGGEERWVVRCVPVPVPVPGGAWDWDDEEHPDKTIDAAESAASSELQNIKDEQLIEVEQLQKGDDADDGNINIDPAHSHSWDSDSSSDLFDLNLE